MSDDQDENESFAPAIQQTRPQTSTSIR
ncbi:unnamed protein product, partial [Rotaria socialis]